MTSSELPGKVPVLQFVGSDQLTPVPIHVTVAARAPMGPMSAGTSPTAMITFDKITAELSFVLILLNMLYFFDKLACLLITKSCMNNYILKSLHESMSTASSNQKTCQQISLSFHNCTYNSDQYGN